MIMCQKPVLTWENPRKDHRSGEKPSGPGKTNKIQLILEATLDEMLWFEVIFINECSDAFITKVAHQLLNVVSSMWASDWRQCI